MEKGALKTWRVARVLPWTARRPAIGKELVLAFLAAGITGIFVLAQRSAGDVPCSKTASGSPAASLTAFEAQPLECWL